MRKSTETERFLLWEEEKPLSNVKAEKYNTREEKTKGFAKELSLTHNLIHNFSR